MKNIINQVLLIVLILLSLATGMTKIMQMPAEMALFENAGFTKWMIIAFGVIQLLGGLLLLPTRYRKYGAILMLATFIVATIVVFMKGMVGFGLASLLFIALAGYQWKINSSVPV